VLHLQQKELVKKYVTMNKEEIEAREKLLKGKGYDIITVFSLENNRFYVFIQEDFNKLEDVSHYKIIR